MSTEERQTFYQQQQREPEVLSQVAEKIDLIIPTTGKLFFEHKEELVFCKPHLMPLRSQALQRLDEMNRETARQLQQKRTKVADTLLNNPENSRSH